MHFALPESLPLPIRERSAVGISRLSEHLIGARCSRQLPLRHLSEVAPVVFRPRLTWFRVDPDEPSPCSWVLRPSSGRVHS